MGLLLAGARVSGEISLGGDQEGGASSSPTNVGERVRTGALAQKNLVGLGEEQWRQVREREIAMIFQEPMTSLNPVMRAGEFVELGPANVILERLQGEYTKELLAAVPEIPRTGQV